MDALSLLKKQHREVEQLFQKVKKAEGLDKEAAFLQLADELATHASVEEKVFYPSVMSDQTDDDLQEAVEEHLEMKRTLADMLDMETADQRFDAKMETLEDQVRHHVSEEENELFKRVAQEFGKDVLERLGSEMERLAMIIRETEPADEIASQSDQASPLGHH